eukprot:TsM_001059400 transcript=TsM_001059400 gene=TsM_001059400
MWVNGLPTNLLHAIYSVLLGLIYAVFSYVYYDTRDMHPIYPVLNWSKPAEAAGASAIAITTTVGFVLRLPSQPPFQLFGFEIPALTSRKSVCTEAIHKWATASDDGSKHLRHSDLTSLD